MLTLQRRLKISFFPFNYSESECGERLFQPHTSCKIVRLTLFSASPSKPGLFVLAVSSGARGAVSVCCDEKLRAELLLMAAAETSEG